MPKIQVLADEVISQIAAGEVVERPASVVKELMENSLDAGAQNIHIDIVDGGQKRIRISDDGQGIPADEVQLALMRHATSKLRSAEDLQRIRTLGFRGEALSSVAAVSHLTLVTRHRDEELGSQIRVEGGRLAQNKAIGSPAGTVITVENLFYNTPARLKFMKSENTEKRNIAKLVMNYAMAYPQIRFVLMQDGREAFRSAGSGNLADVVVKVLGLDYFKEMLEVSGEELIRTSGGTIRVFGFVSQPSLHRKDRSAINLFVNGRAVQDNGLTYAVTQAYHSLMEKGRNPFAVLLLDLPPDFVDVNVHPTKAEVRFQDTNTVFSAVQRTVRQAVLGYKQVERHGNYGLFPQEERGWALPYDRNRQMDMGLPVDETLPEPEKQRDEQSSYIPEGLGRSEQARTLPPLRVVGQVGAAYIVAEGPAGLYLIDQFAAHSRLLCEELQAIYAQQNSLPHRPLDSQTIELSTNDAKILEKHLELLEKLGFLLEGFGANSFLIRAIPSVLKTGEPATYVWAMLEVLGEKPDNLQEALLIRIAERAAIKAGQILDVEEMRGLVRKLERCPNPLISPSGLATLIHMSAQELEREFMRSRK
jgi:DNA mismatch repair protein MutL